MLSFKKLALLCDKPSGGRLYRRLISTENRPKNELILDYVTDHTSKHRLELESQLSELQGQTNDVPIVIAGEEFITDKIRHQVVPFDHKTKLTQFYYASHELIVKATKAAVEARKTWDLVPFSDRLEMLERAADLVSGKYRQRLNAATMLGQAKTIKQAEIDSAAEMADFFRFNAHFGRALLSFSQPLSTKTEINTNEFRALDGFVAAISPFNFTAIGANLVAAPMVMGNSIIWKPSDGAILSNYITFELLLEAGFPKEVMSFVPSAGLDFGKVITAHPDLAGLNFTGSLGTFHWLWNEIGINVRRFKAFPRLVGECGGKNFHLIHKAAHFDTAIAQTIRAAFEYSGQKCSACSRLYVPKSLWPSFRDKLVSITRDELKIGAATDFSSFTSAVIDSKALQRISSYLNHAKSSPSEYKILCGGETNDQIGYYVEPTIIETTNPRGRLMTEEIFGPILTVFVYEDSEIHAILDLINESRFALTGAIFSQDEDFVEMAKASIRMSAGNLYINDKSTGAVVGQQPFGGWRGSGTNDKAGGPFYLTRWTNQQTIKRTIRNLTEYL